MTETIGKYDLKRLLATGGMAEVWVAAQSGSSGSEGEIAIKRILPHLVRDERFTRMFLDEASIASRLAHPNIAQIYELGESDGEYFIAMEYIDGLDLAQILDICEEKGVFIPIDLAARVIANVLSALHFAHSYSENGKCLDVVHRDVSPHNVLVSKSGTIKLVDFGVAKAVERTSKTQTGVVKGKLSYMPPEQIRQDPLDRRADVFAAGVLLHELLTNHPPFGREITAVSAILNDEPPDPREVRPEIPEVLVDVIKHALQKDADDRYATAHEMMQELEAYLQSTDTPMRAREVSAWMVQLQDLAPPAIESRDEATIPDAIDTLGQADTLTEYPKGPKRPPTAELPKASADHSDTPSVPFESPHSVAGPMIGLLVLLVLASGWLFRQELGFGDAEINHAHAASDDQNNSEAEVLDDGLEFHEDEISEDDEPSEVDDDEVDDVEVAADEGADDEMVADDAVANNVVANTVSVFLDYQETDLLWWNLEERLNPQDTRRFDPGDPEVLAVLEQPAKKKRVRKKRKKPRKKKTKKKTKKTKKRSQKKPSKKKKSKKKGDEFRRIDKAMPNF